MQEGMLAQSSLLKKYISAERRSKRLEATTYTTYFAFRRNSAAPPKIWLFEHAEGANSIYDCLPNPIFFLPTL